VIRVLTEDFVDMEGVLGAEATVARARRRGAVAPAKVHELTKNENITISETYGTHNHSVVAVPLL
jgi:hypothetical protein